MQLHYHLTYASQLASSDICKTQSSSDICKKPTIGKWYLRQVQGAYWIAALFLQNCAKKKHFQLYAAKSMMTDTLTWLLHHHDRLRLHQLIGNSSSQRVHLIIVIQDITAMTVVGNRGGDKGRH